MTYPAVGAPAPDFTLDTDAGTPLTLSSLRGVAPTHVDLRYPNGFAVQQPPQPPKKKA